MKKQISEYSFHEFLQAFQDAVIEGYRLDLESNDHFPQKFGSHMEVTLVIPEAVLPQSNLVVEKQPLQPQELTPEQKTIVEAVPEVTSETVTPVKTRKGK